ncbi:MAG: hypothetical protein KA314_01510 [Chloroflexi bacterium]|nr:hypothetical protein [Chloroflexota bacterium]MBP8054485.1 hypothetical protein [Chloroflexota bacterium]
MSSLIANPLDGLPDHIKARIPEEIKRKTAEHKALQESLSELTELLYISQDDLSKLAKLVQGKEQDMTLRRAIYRAIFASIEGIVYQMKQVAFKTQGGYYQAEFSRQEIIFLLEESHYLEEKGETNIRYTNFVEINKNLRFAFSMLAKGFQTNTKLNVGGVGWEAFQKAIKIRNRLTHPKKTHDWIVSNEDMTVVMTAFNWFNQEITQLLKDMNATTESKLIEIKAITSAEQQKFNEQIIKHFARAGEVESVVKIIEDVMAYFNQSDQAQVPSLSEKLLTAQAKLKALMGDILNDANQ